jgi:replication-associated recombination protein RarA
VRRNDARLGGYWAIELFESGYAPYAWRRLLTVSAEDCAGLITTEVKALFDSWKVIHDSSKANPKNRGKARGRIFLAKAVVLLCQARKSRDADHLTNLVYDPKAMDDKVLAASIAEARKQRAAIPDYAFDCHTREGKRRGKTRADFFLDEHDALQPRMPGLFDDDLEALRKSVRTDDKFRKTWGLDPKGSK